LALLGHYIKEIGSTQLVTLVYLLFTRSRDKGSSTLSKMEDNLGQGNPVNTVHFALL